MSAKNNWFNLKTGSGAQQCFNKADIPKMPFKFWKDQVPTCAGGNNKEGTCYQNCVPCTQNEGCSGQYCDSLKTPRKLYTLGPKVSIKAEGQMKVQPYKFPLDLEYPDKSPPLSSYWFPWSRVP